MWWKDPKFIAIVVWITAEAIIDSFTPRGFADWMSYAIPIFLTSWYSKRVTMAVTSIVTILTINGFIISPQLHQAPAYFGISLFNRSLGITIFWIMAILINRRRAALDQMQLAHVELKKGAEQLIESERMKTTFLADTSHELRTPLAIIQSHLDLALGEKSRSVTNPYEELQGIQTEVRHLSGVIANLITLARTSPSKQNTIHVSRTSIRELVSETIEKYMPLAQKEHVNITNEVPNIICNVDTEKIEKVFSNLLANAIQYGKPGGQVHITAHDKNDRVLILFADTGIGIPEKDIPHVFERFYRVASVRKTHESGTGLGLAICKSLVEAHGGTISVESILDKGTTFTISLPSDSIDLHNSRPPERLASRSWSES